MRLMEDIASLEIWRNADIPLFYRTKRYTGYESHRAHFKAIFVFMTKSTGRGKTQWCFDFMRSRWEHSAMLERRLAEYFRTAKKGKAFCAITGMEFEIYAEEKELMEIENLEKWIPWFRKNKYVDYKKFNKDFFKKEKSAQLEDLNDTAFYSDGLLFLDDIPLFETQAQKDHFHEIINVRYMYKLRTVFASQYSLAEVVKHLNPETTGRLLEMSKMVTLDNTENFRTQKGVNL